MGRILFFADAMGQALNCVAIGQVLLQRGHEVICVADTSYRGTFAKYGLREHLIPIHGSSSDSEAAQAWIDHVASCKRLFRLSTIEQLEKYAIPYFDQIVDSSINAQPHLKEAIEKIRPDIICVDDVVLYPAVIQSQRPWVRIVSCNEGELKDPLIPPQLSGYSVKDRSAWPEFIDTYDRLITPIHRRFNRFLEEQSLPKLDKGVFLDPSPYLNLLIYPMAVAYKRQTPLSKEKFIYLNGCVREEATFDIPESFKTRGHPIIYLSYGSMGAFDIELIRSQIVAFADEEFCLIANVGDSIDQYRGLPKNVMVDKFFPQPSVIAQCDLVIHHGGNNTFNESLYYGKPSIILPFAWDGHDNAARVEDLGIGVRLDRYKSEPNELPAICQRLLSDPKIMNKLRAIGKEMRESPGPIVASEAILRVLS
jgi:MGT family glycosyltransferase